eukprot:s2720_g9.t1
MATPGATEILALGVDAGVDIVPGGPEWARLLISPGCIVEISIRASSIGVGSLRDDWFAMLVTEVSGDRSQGFDITGTFLGSESEGEAAEIQGLLESGSVHLCVEEPCPRFTDGSGIHATKFRLWRPNAFQAEYVTKAGAAAVKKAATKLARQSKPPAPRREVKKKPAVKTPSTRPTKRRRPPSEEKEDAEDVEPVIPVPSGSEEDAAPGEAGRRGLKSILKKTRERILGQRPPAKKTARDEDSDGGSRPAGSGRAVGSRTLVAGTSLNPRHQTPLALAGERDTSGSGMPGLMKRLVKSGNASSALLAQAVQTSAEALETRRKKKKSSSKDKVLKALTTLIQDKKGRKRHKRDRDRRRSRSRGRKKVKPDPDGEGPSDSSGYSSDYSSGDSKDRGDRSDADSELSFEAPLRRRAMRDPGSVMDMLVRHAQQQLDQGALLEAEGAQPSVTSGVKISTYFALLIRPYHAAGSPLLRELYSLAQAIDLLRMGRLPETADALASRFIAVHTALSEGNWTTAAQLELYPLEPVQSASTATMLEAHKHRRLVMKSQGLTPGSRWWPAAGRGKGAPQTEKGKKGDGKRNKGKGKGAGKESTWSQKGDPSNNAWASNKEEPPKK